MALTRERTDRTRRLLALAQSCPTEELAALRALRRQVRAGERSEW